MYANNLIPILTYQLFHFTKIQINKIKTVLRIRPYNSNPAVANKYSQLEYDINPLDNSFKIPNQKDLDKNLNLKLENEDQTQSTLTYKFDAILDQQSSQESAFKQTENLLNNFVEGINACCFVAGATGVGKTYTISGSTDFETRGILARTLEFIFQYQRKYQQNAESEDNKIQFYLSYAQIYNEQGYDLLSYDNDSLASVNVNQLQRFDVLEVQPNVMKFRNLSRKKVDSIDEGINYVFQGDLNKMTIQTQQNQASSRSHSIFSIFMEKHENNEIISSRYNIVDLAGNERAALHGEQGLILQQANYINVSLFHFETVINELQKKSNFIPWRNTLLTRYLKDSIGGNALCTMFCCIAPEKYDVYQTIQSCNFAMRCSMIEVKAEKNIKVDYKLLVEKLQKENQLLKEEIMRLKSGQDHQQLTEEQLRQIAQQYVNSKDETYKPEQFLNDDEYNQVIKYIMELVIQEEQQPIQISDSKILELQSSLQQRDQEIMVLSELLENKQPDLAKSWKYDYIDSAIQLQKSEQNNNQNKQDQQIQIQKEEQSQQQIQQNNQQKQQELIYQILQESIKYCNTDISKFNNKQIDDQQFICTIYANENVLKDNGEKLQNQIKESKNNKNNTEKDINNYKQQVEQLKSQLFEQLKQNKIENQETDKYKQQIIEINDKYKNTNKQLKEITYKIQQDKLQLQNIKQQIKDNFNTWYKLILDYQKVKSGDLSIQYKTKIDNQLEQIVNM